MVSLELFALIQNINKYRVNLMVRILGHNLINKKKICIALTAIYGIEFSNACKVLNNLNINPNLKVAELADKEISLLRDFLENNNLKVEGDLKRDIQFNIKRLIEINSYRGRRHLKGLPVRGQRTRTNSRTSRKLNSFAK